MSSAFESLFSTISTRRETMPPDSYTTSLFEKGRDHICLKVAEESAEVLRAVTKETRERLIEESIDLIYHLFVLLNHQDVTFEEIVSEAKKRM